jgi:cytochrome c heme-lyase
MGGGKPFDRHDWWIERGDEEIRYVVDYYFKEDKAGTPEQFEFVVRPALDSFESALDRAKMFTYVNCARFGVPCPITGSASVIGEQAAGEKK